MPITEQERSVTFTALHREKETLEQYISRLTEKLETETRENEIERLNKLVEEKTAAIAIVEEQIIAYSPRDTPARVVRSRRKR